LGRNALRVALALRAEVPVDGLAETLSLSSDTIRRHRQRLDECGLLGAELWTREHLLDVAASFGVDRRAEYRRAIHIEERFDREHPPEFGESRQNARVRAHERVYGKRSTPVGEDAGSVVRSIDSAPSRRQETTPAKDCSSATGTDSK
jgi:hypothetical protein